MSPETRNIIFGSLPEKTITIAPGTVDAVRELVDRSLLPHSENAVAIGEYLTRIVHAIGESGEIPTFCEGLLVIVNGDKTVVSPVVSISEDKSIVVTNSDNSLSLYPLEQQEQVLLEPCELAEGKIVKSGYLSFLNAKDFQFAGEQPANMFDARSTPVSRFACQIFAIAKNSSKNKEQREQLLETLKDGLLIPVSNLENRYH